MKADRNTVVSGGVTFTLLESQEAVDINEKEPRRTKGEGSYYTMANGRIRFTVPYKDFYGASHKLTTYGNTRAEAKRKADAELRENRIRGDQRAKVKLSSFAQDWITSKATKKPRTLRNYQDILDRYILPHLGQISLRDLRPESLQRWALTLEQKHGSGTSKRSVDQLRRILKVAVNWDYIPRNAAESLRIEHKPRRKLTWNSEQLKQFLRVAQGHPLYPFFLLQCATGARIGELQALTWYDVQTQAIRINKTASRLGTQWQISTPKSEAGTRIVSVDAPILVHLEAHRQAQEQQLLQLGIEQTPSTPVFASVSGTMRDYSNIRRELQALCERAGLPYMSSHGFRRAYASMQHENGVPDMYLAKLMGHRDASTTKTCYIQADEGKLPNYALASGKLLDLD
jgi:integrase